jgi:hypothetical protein
MGIFGYSVGRKKCVITLPTNTQIRTGVWGLGGTLIGNLVTLLVFKKQSARFFTADWWESWTAIYLVWVVFLIIGLAKIIFSKGEKDKKTTE